MEIWNCSANCKVSLQKFSTKLLEKFQSLKTQFHKPSISIGTQSVRDPESHLKISVAYNILHFKSGGMASEQHYT